MDSAEYYVEVIYGARSATVVEANSAAEAIEKGSVEAYEKGIADKARSVIEIRSHRIEPGDAIKPPRSSRF